MSNHTTAPRGPLAWMASNPVAANVFMVLLIVGGLIIGRGMKQEVFPEFELDYVTITVVHPGATPEEVEQGSILAIESAVQGLDGVKEVTAVANESVGMVVVELLLGTDADEAVADIRSAVDRITSFPDEIEDVEVKRVNNRNRSVSLILYGDVDEYSLRQYADQVRDDLITDDRITLVEVNGVRPLEISVEVPSDVLREFDLTLSEIAQRISAGSVDLPGGSVETSRGDVFVRTTERRERGSEFADLVILSRPDGTEVHLSDIAQIDDGFSESEFQMQFNGQRAARIDVFRVGDETPIEVSRALYDYIEEHENDLPPGLSLAVWNDMSEMYQDRIDLLMRNAMLGLILVLVVLGLFLEVKLAFWVMLGIPISFLGALLFLPGTGVSINMISLFAFILTLGIVVDDAIVVGEAVYKHRADGMKGLDAAIAGLKEVAVPVTYSVTTTMIFFVPMFFVPGFMGKIFKVIPIIALTVFGISLFESLFILPAHLAHSEPMSTRGLFGFVRRGQLAFSRGLDKFIDWVYLPILRGALRHRGITLAMCLAMLILAIGWTASGRIDFTFLPKIEGDQIAGMVTLPYGSPIERTREVHHQLAQAADEVLQELGADASRGVLSNIGGAGEFNRGPGGGGTSQANHLGEVAVYLVPADQRDFTAGEFVQRWRERVGEIPGIENLRFAYTIGPGGGAPIDIELSHRDQHILESAAERLALELSEFEGVQDIDDGFAAGNEQLELTLRPEARTLGITALDLARQLRSSFFGAEAARQQRGRDEVRVYVRLPDSERDSEYNLESMVLQTPMGGEIALAQATNSTRSRSYTAINRRNGRRVVNVTADVDNDVTNGNKVVADLVESNLPALENDVPGLTFELGGESQEQAETMVSLMVGMLTALLAMYGLMSIAFKSYLQPLIIMSIIPFGFVGALVGHILLGFDLSMMSMLGLVALAGIVVNDSLILIDATNVMALENPELTPTEAVITGAARRFRPILLTSLTTFLGLMPMILETSVQARFLIPMALSLGFGVMFATFVMLVMVPCIYVQVEQIRSGLQRYAAWMNGDDKKKHQALDLAGGE
ncbi:MAG: efflux RND transporter permease subunit [Myxococcales bacterium]|nr:efflux RND transporter permease subunit [Myxococcales bacterium]